jgi:hypothetical protein
MDITKIIQNWNETVWDNDIPFERVRAFVKLLAPLKPTVKEVENFLTDIVINDFTVEEGIDLLVDQREASIFFKSVSLTGEVYTNA